MDSRINTSKEIHESRNLAWFDRTGQLQHHGKNKEYISFHGPIALFGESWLSACIHLTAAFSLILDLSHGIFGIICVFHFGPRQLGVLGCMDSVSSDDEV